MGKLNIFISWSHHRGGMMADALQQWLQQVNPNFLPWCSRTDLQKGTPWPAELLNQLDRAEYGVVCLTPESITSAYQFFEAGSLAKKVGVNSGRVCPYLLDLEPAHLVSTPYALFQATVATRDGTLALITSMNKLLGEDARPDESVRESLEVWWPKLAPKLSAIPKSQSDPPKITVDDRRHQEVLRALGRLTDEFWGFHERLANIDASIHTSNTPDPRHPIWLPPVSSETTELPADYSASLVGVPGLRESFKGQWRGVYVQGGRETSFTLTIDKSGRGRFSGRTTEAGQLGPASVKGTYSAKRGLISFLKTYQSTDSVPVQYHGALTATGVINGKWFIGRYVSGTFRMEEPL